MLGNRIALNQHKREIKLYVLGSKYLLQWAFHENSGKGPYFQIHLIPYSQQTCLIGSNLAVSKSQKNEGYFQSIDARDPFQ